MHGNSMKIKLMLNLLKIITSNSLMPLTAKREAMKSVAEI